MTNSSIQEAMNEAKAAAGQLATDVVLPIQGQLVTYGRVMPDRNISLMENLVRSFAVDSWRKVKPCGTNIPNRVGNRH